MRVRTFAVVAALAAVALLTATAVTPTAAGTSSAPTTFDELTVAQLTTLRDLDLGFTEELARLAPFGVANREPLFALSGVTARATRVVGKDHLQLTLDHRGTTGEAIAFGFAEADPGAGARVDLVATAELDTFRGVPRARLKVARLARAG